MSFKKFFGQSLSQRLNAAGVASQFSGAVISKNSSEMSRILKELDYSSESTNAMVKTLRKNPKSFRG